MKKKSMALLLCVVLLFVLSSCDSSDVGVIITQPVKVAVGLSSPLDCLAAHDYASQKGYEIIEFETRQAAIIAVENGKADYVIINSGDATREFLSNVNLEFLENTEYRIEYCAVISKANQDLKADVNEAIYNLKANGTLQRINEAYINGEDYVCNGDSLYENSITILCSPVFENLIYTDTDGILAGKELDFIRELCNELSLEAKISVVKEYDEMFTALDR